VFNSRFHSFSSIYRLWLADSYRQSSLLTQTSGQVSFTDTTTKIHFLDNRTLLGIVGFRGVRIDLHGGTPGFSADLGAWATQFFGLYGYSHTQEQFATFGDHLKASWNRNLALFQNQNFDFGENEFDRSANYYFFHLESDGCTVTTVHVRFVCNRNGSNPIVTYDFNAGSVFDKAPGILIAGHYKGLELLGTVPDDPYTQRFSTFLTHGIPTDDLTLPDAFSYFGNLIEMMIEEHKGGGPAAISRKVDAATISGDGVEWVVQGHDFG